MFFGLMAFWVRVTMKTKKAKVAFYKELNFIFGGIDPC